MEGIISSYEAKTKFGALIDRVLHGEEIVITRNDIPVARIIPEGTSRREDLTDMIAAMIKRRADCSINKSGLPKISMKELIEDGRR